MTTQPDDLVPEAESDDREYEIIKHPEHYNSHPSGVECIEIVQHMPFNVGTAVKHLWRAGLKPNMEEVDDIKKAITYLEFELKRLETPIYTDQPLVRVGTVVGVLADGKVTAETNFR